MPGFQIHLAIGNRYIKKHEIKDKEQFLKGIIAPDFEVKENSHYTRKTSKDNLIEYLKNKVIIENFLKENEVKTDYQKGVFLHLLTDKLFFTEFFPKEYLQTIGYQNFCRDLYTSYDETNPYIEKKYHVVLSEEILEKMKQNIQDSKKEKQMKDEKGDDILPLNKLDEFIEKMSDIRIEEYIEFQKNK